MLINLSVCTEINCSVYNNLTNEIRMSGNSKFPMHAYKTRLKKNSTWEDALYQSEWVTINSNWVIFIMCFSANASELFCIF